MLTCLAEIILRREAENNTVQTEDKCTLVNEAEADSDLLELTNANENV